MLWTILIGFVIGLIARALMPGKDAFGLIMTIFLGIAGSWVGSLIAGKQVGLVGSVLGAVLVLFLYRAIRKK